MDQITKNLYLGSWKDAKEIKGTLGWSVVSVANDTPFVGDYFFPMTDPGDKPEDKKNFRLAVDKIIELLNEEKNVLVHCVAGVNRSPAVTIATLLLLHPLLKPLGVYSLKDAFLLVQKCRSQIDPCTQQLKLACEIAGLDWEKEDFQPPVAILSEHEQAVNSLYKLHLERKADPDGLNHYSYLLASGRRSIKQIEDILISSEEYKKKHSSS